jgi:hypothetical protein
MLTPAAMPFAAMPFATAQSQTTAPMTVDAAKGLPGGAPRGGGRVQPSEVITHQLF